MAFYSLTHFAGVLNDSNSSLTLNHFLGAITILPSFPFSHAPHQLKLLFATILCLQALINSMSLKEFSAWFRVTKCIASVAGKFWRHHSISSEKTNNSCLPHLSRINLNAVR